MDKDEKLAEQIEKVGSKLASHVGTVASRLLSKLDKWLDDQKPDKS